MNKTHLIMSIWLLITHNTVYTKALQLQATWLQYNLDRLALNNDAFSSNWKTLHIQKHV